MTIRGPIKAKPGHHPLHRSGFAAICVSFAAIRVETETPRPRNGNPTHSSTGLHLPQFAAICVPFAAIRVPSHPHPSCKSVPIRGSIKDGTQVPPSHQKARRTIRTPAVRNQGLPRFVRGGRGGMRRLRWPAGGRWIRAGFISVAWKNGRTGGRPTVEQRSPPRPLDQGDTLRALGKNRLQRMSWKITFSAGLSALNSIDRSTTPCVSPAKSKNYK